MIKKIFTLLTFICLLMGTQPSKAQLDFPDVRTNHWAYNNVKILKNLGIVVGYPDGNFKPDEFVTRAEFSSMAVKALRLSGQAYVPVAYKDVTSAYWGYENIQIASYFSLVSGHTGGMFLPNDDVKRVEVISVIMSALNLDELTNQDAIKFLQDYQDANLTPSWAIAKTAQAQKMGMIVIMPGREGYLEPLRPATRGELAVFLCNMIDAAEKMANEKISKTRDGDQQKQREKALKLYDGHVLENVYVDGNYAILPAGTILPMAVIACTESEKTKSGHDFRARATKNFITKDKRLLIPVGSQLFGIFQDVKKPKLFVRNAHMVLASNTLRNSKNPDASMAFNSVSSIDPIYNGKNIWDKISFYIIKGKNTPLHKSSLVDFILLEPIRIEIKDEWVYL